MPEPRKKSHAHDDRARRVEFCFGENFTYDAEDLAAMQRLFDDDSDAHFELFDAHYMPPEPNDSDEENFEVDFQEVALAFCMAIWADDVPLAWERVQELHALGAGRDRILREFATLVDVEGIGPDDIFTETVIHVVETHASELPLPLYTDLADAIQTSVQMSQGIEFDDLLASVAADFDLEWTETDSDDGYTSEPFTTRYLDSVAEAMLDDGILILLAGDRVVEPSMLIDNKSFTMRFDASTSRQRDILTGTDLAAYAFHRSFRTSTGQIAIGRPVTKMPGGLVGSPGWLPEVTDRSAVAFRSDGHDLELTVLPSDVAFDSLHEARIVAGIREAYDRNFDGSAVEAYILILDALLQDRELFDRPVRPLSELLIENGLHVDGDFVFHHEHASRYRKQLGRAIGSIVRTMDLPETQRRDVSKLLDALERVEGLSVELIANGDDPESFLPADTGYEVRPPLPTREVANALASLLDHEAFAAFSAEFLGVHEERSQYPASARDEFIRQALDATRDLHGKSQSDRKLIRALLYILASIHHEQERDFVSAESDLRMARVEHDTLIEPIRRLAFYALERNDIRNALALLQTIRDDENPDSQLDRQLHDLRSQTKSSAPKVGRNDPCWCGSGRKFKQCHLNNAGGVELAALPERAALLWTKARMFVEVGTAAIRTEPLEEAFASGFAPDSNHLDGLSGIGLRGISGGPQGYDPRTGRSMSMHTTGHTIARQLGTVSDIALLEGGYLNKYLSERGELLPADEQFLLTTWCMAERGVFEVLSTTSDTMTVRNTKTFLEHTIDRSRDADRNPPKVGTHICAFVSSDSVCARIFGAQFHVPVGRTDQVQNLLDDAPPEELAEWVGGLYGPPRIRKGNTGMKSILEGLDTDDLVIDSETGAGMQTLMALVRDRVETAWIDESIPALRGSTPRELVADPTRREEVVRLINSFGGEDENTPMRPSRLRELLGISPDE